MSADVRKTPASITHTNLILVGEAFTLPVKLTSPEEVDDMLKLARPRFAQNGLWTISAGTVEKILPKVRDRLRVAFEEFRKAGGIKILVINGNPFVAVQFMGAARDAGNIDLQIVAKPELYAPIAAAFRDKFHPKPKPGPPK